MSQLLMTYYFLHYNQIFINFMQYILYSKTENIRPFYNLPQQFISIHSSKFPLSSSTSSYPQLHPISEKLTISKIQHNHSFSNSTPSQISPTPPLTPPPPTIPPLPIVNDFLPLIIPQIQINIIFSFCNSPNKMQKQSKTAYICILGNDGTGKSTICSLINSKTHYQGVQRSMKITEDQNVRKLVKEIKRIDQLTYKYAFEDDWYQFDVSRTVDVQGQLVEVIWVMLAAPVKVLNQRIGRRTDMTIYEHEKCIQYFNYVYQQLAYFYGMHLINSDQPPQSILSQISTLCSSPTTRPPLIPLKSLTIPHLQSNDLQSKIAQQLQQAEIQAIYDQKVLVEMEEMGMREFYFPGLCGVGGEGKRALVARWVRRWGRREFVGGDLVVKIVWGIQKEQEHSITIKLEHGYLFQSITQGQSKILYKLLTPTSTTPNPYTPLVFILLKSTIYSHTNQHTSQISHLSKIRAKGSMIFLQMLKRNHIKHSYVCVNRDGIILSREVRTTELEVVFKKECLGTDKHAYFGVIGKEGICDDGGRYYGGIYVRFDWRNPNHIFLPNPKKILNLDPYYYPLQTHTTKQTFFTKYLQSPTCKPMGDKCISQDLISTYTNTKKIKQKVIQTYCAFQYYAGQVGLEILDGCVMVDQGAEWIWSEINPDCLRVKSVKDREDYDKDIWRAGGSASKETIIKKWSIFNDIFVTYFKSHRFMQSQLPQPLLPKQLHARSLLTQPLRPKYSSIYRSLYRGTNPRQVICTLDIINGQPILVQSSQFKEKHSNSSIGEALDYLRIAPKVLVVDIDGAMGKGNNRGVIEEIGGRGDLNLFAVGGGIRDIETANSYLTQFQHIVISSNLDLIPLIPQNHRSKIIVQLSINPSNEILTHGRTINTKTPLTKKLQQLSQLGIETVSITFNAHQGKLQGLPRQQLKKLMYEVPGPIKKVIIAGGISSIEDVEYVWSIGKCVPQLGSAIWKRRVLIGDLVVRMVRFGQDQLLPAVIQDQYKKNLGLVYMNEQALFKTCEQRLLYRYSRQHNRVMLKGESSGNTQKILSINLDCDNDSILITVSTEHPIFCHKQTQSCFFEDLNKSTRMGLNQIQAHILKSKVGGGSGYGYKVQNDSKLAIGKVLEEAEELSLAESRGRRVEECADLMAHMLMYMNSQGIDMAQVEALLNKRSKIQKKPSPLKISKSESVIRVGIAAGKHTKLIFQFLQNTMGVRILSHPAGKQRNYTINYEITDKQKFSKALKIPTQQPSPSSQSSQSSSQMEPEPHKVIFISMKPKDLSKLMYKNYINYGINYSNVVQNSCNKFHVLAETKVQGLRLALIKRKGEMVDIGSWSENNKGVVVSEYPLNVVQYFKEKNVPSNYYSLIKVSGHSEGFLSDSNFDYCDAIVFSGKTIEDNQLEIQAVIKSEIKVILFTLAN